MTITLTDAAKRFGYEWIFRGLTYRFEVGKRYAIAGPNGVGKSTLMKVLSGHLSLSRGKISFEENGRLLDPSTIYRRVSMAAPYIELIEELTLNELVHFHGRLRPFRFGMTAKDVLEWIALKGAHHKTLRFFSSGMKQRVRLALALCTEAPILLLDEPTTNLDEEGIRWFVNLLNLNDGQRIVIIASNVAEDLNLCTQTLFLQNYKS
ncbi:MAG: ABC transporter ATP-binding protein [Saprospiraceae bacterium]|nr:ABC transporter ATP-binding protein [Saprospiraceae bacterium]MDW8484846.1 ABC transporter ATP-binding protein [Saprospiraceae bacterium]